MLAAVARCEPQRYLNVGSKLMTMCATFYQELGLAPNMSESTEFHVLATIQLNVLLHFA